MVEIIAGAKGKGKTKFLLDKVNSAVIEADGNIVYLDKNQKHTHELSNRVRLINVSDYPIFNRDEFIGFICGIVSQDYDLQEMYLDSFLTIANLEDELIEEAADTIKAIEDISNRFQVKFILSVSRDEADLPDSLKENIIISL